MESIDRFTVVRPLSDGPGARVVLATDQLGQKVRITILPQSRLPTTDSVKEFLDSAVDCGRLSHPSLLRVLEAGQTPDGRAFLVSEWVDAEDLSQRLARIGKLTPRIAVRLALEVCEVLGYAHDNGIVHGDLHPGNILLPGPRSEVGARVSGFGVRVGGSPAFVPPELLTGQRPDSRSDFYALGAVLHHALTGSPPFAAITDDEVRRMVLEEPAPHMPGQIHTLDYVVQQCLAKDPESRFQSAAELIESLQATEDVTVASKSTALEGLVPSAAATPAKSASRDKQYGAYEVVEELGSGGMGTVYLARHARIGRKVAIKVLRPEHANSHEAVNRFFQEARAVNQVNHENIVQVFDFVQEPGRVYCVMELLEGATLFDTMRNSPISVARCAGILRQVCLALHAAHQVGVVHRDVKPENVFLTQRQGHPDFVKVLDFGIAKLNPATTGSPVERTMEGIVLGTPEYMSPEQAVGKEVDFRTDVYSVGVMLHELLAGRLPFQDSTFPKLAVQIVTRAAPPLPPRNALGEPIPEEMASLTEWCMQKDPADRPPSAAEVASVLEPFAEITNAESRSVVSASAQQSAASSQARRFPIVSAILLIVLAVGGGAIWRVQLSRAVDLPKQVPAQPAAPSLPETDPGTPEQPSPRPELIPVHIGSHPAGAEIAVRPLAGGDERRAITPADLSLSPGDYIFTAKLDGYLTKSQSAHVDLKNPGIQIQLVEAAAPVSPKPENMPNPMGKPMGATHVGTENATARPRKKPAKKAPIDEDDIIDPYVEKKH
jgi:eukaryotic-like serine/threonine-protein kinase